MIALVDCNNFYASCETIFRPDLIGKPVVVLSNNDGCVIARSQEAKDLGVRMGEPYFKCKTVLMENKVSVFSSNFALYGDISNRVMAILRKYTSDLEVYSVDEAFLDLSHVPAYKVNSVLRAVAQDIFRSLGIRVSIGFASTKTLAKAANYFAKKTPGCHGVLNFYEMSQFEKDKFLRKLPVSEIWGVGRKYAEKLHSFGVENAFAFLQQSPDWVKSSMTVVGLKTFLELRGESCLKLEVEPQPKKSIVCSKSFGDVVTDIDVLDVALSNFASNVSRKLRLQNSECFMIGVFIQNNRFASAEPFNASFCVSIPDGSSNASELIKFAKKALRYIFKPGVKYKKIGVFVSEISKISSLQLSFFDANLPKKKSLDTKIMMTLDNLNKKYGRDSVSLAACVGDESWKMKNESRSPRYTTCLNELKLIKI